MKNEDEEKLCVEYDTSEEIEDMGRRRVIGDIINEVIDINGEFPTYETVAQYGEDRAYLTDLITNVIVKIMRLVDIKGIKELNEKYIEITKELNDIYATITKPIEFYKLVMKEQGDEE